MGIAALGNQNAASALASTSLGGNAQSRSPLAGLLNGTPDNSGQGLAAGFPGGIAGLARSTTSFDVLGGTRDPNAQQAVVLTEALRSDLATQTAFSQEAQRLNANGITALQTLEGLRGSLESLRGTLSDFTGNPALEDESEGTGAIDSGISEFFRTLNEAGDEAGRSLLFGDRLQASVEDGSEPLSLSGFDIRGRAEEAFGVFSRREANNLAEQNDETTARQVFERPSEDDSGSSPFAAQEISPDRLADSREALRNGVEDLEELIDTAIQDLGRQLGDVRERSRSISQEIEGAEASLLQAQPEVTGNDAVSRLAQFARDGLQEQQLNIANADPARLTALFREQRQEADRNPLAVPQDSQAGRESTTPANNLNVPESEQPAQDSSLNGGSFGQAAERFSAASAFSAVQQRARFSFFA